MIRVRDKTVNQVRVKGHNVSHETDEQAVWSVGA